MRLFAWSSLLLLHSSRRSGLNVLVGVDVILSVWSELMSGWPSGLKSSCSSRDMLQGEPDLSRGLRGDIIELCALSNLIVLVFKSVLGSRAARSCDWLLSLALRVIGLFWWRPTNGSSLSESGSILERAGDARFECSSFLCLLYRFCCGNHFEQSRHCLQTSVAKSVREIGRN
jgi:hypothetical protein